MNEQTNDNSSFRDLLPPETITVLNPVWLDRPSVEFTVRGQSQLTGNEFLSAKQIADIFDVPYHALRRRLERFRKDPSDAVIESAESRQNQPKYLYRLNGILDEIKALRSKRNVHRNKVFQEIRRQKSRRDDKTDAKVSIEMKTENER